MQDKDVIISVDGGGSNTKFCVMDISTKEKKYFSYGSTNYKAIGLEKTEKNLVNAFNEISNKLDLCEENINGVVFGLSGLDTPRDYDVYSTLLDKLNIDKKKIYLCNDSELAFYSKGKIPGLVVIAGTGSISYGINHETKSRSGGWGSPVSDLGSGYWIGTEVLKDMLRYCDGYFEYKKVFANVKDYCNAQSFKEVPHIITNYQNNEIASVAKIVCEYALIGDRYSENIIDKATIHIAEMATSVYKKLNLENEQKVDIVLAGSLFKNQFYKERFKEHFLSFLNNKNIEFIISVINPVDGGLNLGLQLFTNNK